jgi:hypothetical protein
MLSRRNLLVGLFAAPAIIRPGLLMPVSVQPLRLFNFEPGTTRWRGTSVYDDPLYLECREMERRYLKILFGDMAERFMQPMPASAS